MMAGKPSARTPPRRSRPTGRSSTRRSRSSERCLARGRSARGRPDGAATDGAAARPATPTGARPASRATSRTCTSCRGSRRTCCSRSARWCRRSPVVLQLGRPDAAAAGSGSTTTARSGTTTRSARRSGTRVELVIWYAIVPILIGLLLTALLTRFRVRGFLFFRTVLFLPQTIATVVVAQAFVWIYDPMGPLNKVLRHGRARAPAHGLAGRLQLGADLGRLDRHVDRVRPLHGALPGRRAEDPDHAVRGGAHRRRGLRARVHRGHAARACATSSSSRRP